FLGDRPDKLAFADRSHFLGAPGAIARSALDEHGLDDVVPRVDVGQQFVEQIAAARMIPEMMMRVDDRQIGFENLLAQLAKPCGVGQRAGIGAGFDRHNVLLEVGNSIVLITSAIWQDLPPNLMEARMNDAGTVPRHMLEVRELTAETFAPYGQIIAP